jgi:glycosyltransferase involved in cell wall biosynthesis
VRRILFVIKGLGAGGAEKLLVSTSKYLDRTRFSVDVAYVLPRKDALAPDLEASGVRVHCLGGGSIAHWGAKLRDLVREREVDVVHSHLPYAAIGARLSLNRRARRVYTEHNVWECYRRATYWGNVLTLHRSDHVFAVSEQVRRSMRYPLGLHGLLPMPTLETLYHGIDPADVPDWRSANGVRHELGIPEDAFVVGCVANFRGEKGHRDLLRAVALLRRRMPGIRLVLVGQGPLERHIRRQAADLRLNGTVVFAGYRHDSPRLATAFDVFALASVHEGLSIALIEAMALGVPAVVTTAGGLPEVIEDGKEGRLVGPNRPRAMAQALLELATDEPLRRQMGNAAEEKARRFDIRTAVTRMEQVYDELTS